MTRRVIFTVNLACCFAVPLSAGQSATNIPLMYQIEPPRVPADDLSGEVGRRLLKLLCIQAKEHMAWVEARRKPAGMADGGIELFVPDEQKRSPYLVLYRASCAICAFAILVRFGSPEQMPGELAPDRLERTALALIRAVAESHPVGGGPKAQVGWWKKLWAPRVDYVWGMGAWLLWDKLDTDTQLLVARALEHDADLFNQDVAPAKLYYDTQAESNAWISSGIALAECMLRHHPRRGVWGDKAREFMISSYATPLDVESSRVIDGKPLNRWLTAPNLFSDYTLENHGLFHPVYLAAISEKVRNAIPYRLAGEPVPEAVTFNADKVFDVLTILNLPDSTHLYVQGTDYTSRVLSSFFQVCNLVPLRPDPFLNACFLRSLGSIERMAAERPELPMDGWLGWSECPGIVWGLTENYMMRRLYGMGDGALPENQIEERLAGVHVFESGQFVIHRTPTTLSSFSWHTSANASQLMGLTMPLDKHVLLYPMPGSLIGDIREATDTRPADQGYSLKLKSHKLQTRRNGLGITLDLQRCLGKVRQQCAFVSLPDGTSVYLEERVALGDVTVASAVFGNVVVHDDVRWVFQSKPRDYFGDSGKLEPEPTQIHATRWINIDDRSGYIAIGATGMHLSRRLGRPGIWRQPDETMYDTCRVEFVKTAGQEHRLSSPAGYKTGESMGYFGLVTCPGRTARDTAALSERISSAGWHTSADEVLALVVGQYLVYANFSPSKRSIPTSAGIIELLPQTAGWVPNIAASQPSSDSKPYN